MEDRATIDMPLRIREAFFLTRSRQGGREAADIDGWDRKRIDAMVARLLARMQSLGRDLTPAEACRVTLSDQARIRDTSPDDPALADFAKAVKLGYAMACATLEGIPSHEASPVLACGDFADEHQDPGPAHGDVPASGPVGFAFVSMEAVKGRRRPRPVARRAFAHLLSASDEEAPVVARLRVPADGTGIESEVALRSWNGHWLRPVLAPGSWRPLGEEGFRHACMSGHAWVDDPFAPPAGDKARLGVNDVAHPPGSGEPQGQPARVAADLAANGAGCLARAGALVVVDGIVHRTTGAPGLHVEVTGTDNRQVRVRHSVVRVGWHLDGDITSSTDQATYGRRVTYGVDDLLAGLTEPSRRVVEFPLGAGDAAACLARELTGSLGGKALARAVADVAPCVEVVDTDAFPTDGREARRILSTLLDRLPAYAFREAWRDKAGIPPFSWAAAEGDVGDDMPDDMPDDIPESVLNPDVPHVNVIARALAGALARTAKFESASFSRGMEPEEEDMAAFRP